MWWLLKKIFVGPSSGHRVSPSERRLDELDDSLGSLSQRYENLRGQVLTLSRRIRRLQEELSGPDDDDELEEEDQTPDEVLSMINERKSRG